MIIGITDSTTGRIANIDRDEVAPELHLWYPGEPEDVAEAIEELQRRLNRGESTDDLETFLAIRIGEAHTHYADLPDDADQDEVDTAVMLDYGQPGDTLTQAYARKDQNDFEPGAAVLAAIDLAGEYGRQVDRGAYDDPAVQRAIHEAIRTDAAEEEAARVSTRPDEPTDLIAYIEADDLCPSRWHYSTGPADDEPTGPCPECGEEA